MTTTPLFSTPIRIKSLVILADAEFEGTWHPVMLEVPNFHSPEGVVPIFDIEEPVQPYYGDDIHILAGPDPQPSYVDITIMGRALRHENGGLVVIKFPSQQEMTQ